MGVDPVWLTASNSIQYLNGGLVWFENISYLACDWLFETSSIICISDTNFNSPIPSQRLQNENFSDFWSSAYDIWTHDEVPFFSISLFKFSVQVSGTKWVRGTTVRFLWNFFPNWSSSCVCSVIWSAWFSSSGCFMEQTLLVNGVNIVRLISSSHSLGKPWVYIEETKTKILSSSINYRHNCWMGWDES